MLSRSNRYPVADPKRHLRDGIMIPDYFKPWRRKIGVLTLLLACGFAAEMVKSYATRYRSGLSDRPVDEQLELINGNLELVRKICRIENGDWITVNTVMWSFPFSSIVLPLTLASAWLLLSSPRTPKKT